MNGTTGPCRRATTCSRSRCRRRPRRASTLEEQLDCRTVPLLNLSSYNYLGMSYRPEVIEAAKRALDRYGLGAAGSPILSGTMDIHVELEEAIAKFKGKEAAMVFPTGYSTNVGMISGLMRPGDWIIADQNSHASIVDGAILSKANVRFFRHNNVADLEKKLRQTTGKKLVAVEGIYSMDGDVCPLPDIVEVCKRYGARILLDEAHSCFVYGPTDAEWRSITVSTTRSTSTSGRSPRQWAARAAMWPGRATCTTTSRASRARACSHAHFRRSWRRACWSR